ncbi:toxin HicA [Thiococcus pfennigii]|nr:toxin HicA [Thiococcus pfennigii]
MGRLDKIRQEAQANPANLRFADLRKLCEHYFGTPRQSGSHLVFKTRTPGDPRVNIQDRGGQAKAYQVKQVLAAIDRLENG